MPTNHSESLVEAVAGNILRLRKQAHLTQTELAEAAGLSRAAIAQIEGQRYSSFSFASLEGIAAALGVPEAELLERPTTAVPKALSKFQKSTWAQALTPSEHEYQLLAAVMQKIGRSSALTPALLAELLQLLRRLGDATST